MTDIDYFWNSIPTRKEDAVTYPVLTQMWNMDERRVRRILHRLSCGDNGDDYVLIRSANGKGFYRTDDKLTIERYRRECLAKGRSLFAPVTKCNRLLNESAQLEVWNNLKVARLSKNMKQSEVCDRIREDIPYFNEALLSRFENGVCIPTPEQVNALSAVYGLPASEVYRYNA